MTPTISLMAAPGESIRWSVGDRVTVTVDGASWRCRVIYVDPQRMSLAAIDEDAK